jgi:hypothetical protein
MERASAHLFRCAAAIFFRAARLTVSFLPAGLDGFDFALTALSLLQPGPLERRKRGQRGPARSIRTTPNRVQSIHYAHFT